MALREGPFSGGSGFSTWHWEQARQGAARCLPRGEEVTENAEACVNLPAFSAAPTELLMTSGPANRTEALWGGYWVWIPGRA
jgi:hypothetical protein